MTTEEFSNEFDVLVNSYNIPFDTLLDRTITMAFNEYEKSVFLTNALWEIVVNLYNGKNVFGDSFESTEETRRYLDELVKTDIQTPILDTSSFKLSTENNSYFFLLPTNLAFITMELVLLKEEDLECSNNKRANVYPVTQDEFSKVRNNPFRGPTKYKVLRLDYGDNKVELISKYNIDKYLIKYLAKPTPIILVDLPDNLKIDNNNTRTECTLNPILHKTILNRAVVLAVQSKQLGSVNTTTTTTSTTNNN